MKKDEATSVENKKKLVLRRDRSRVVDSVELSPVAGGGQASATPWVTDSIPPQP